MGARCVTRSPTDDTGLLRDGVSREQETQVLRDVPPARWNSSWVYGWAEAKLQPWPVLTAGNIPEPVPDFFQNCRDRQNLNTGEGHVSLLRPPEASSPVTCSRADLTSPLAQRPRGEVIGVRPIRTLQRDELELTEPLVRAGASRARQAGARRQAAGGT